jgi:hypothetical protein
LSEARRRAGDGFGVSWLRRLTARPGSEGAAAITRARSAAIVSAIAAVIFFLLQQFGGILGDPGSAAYAAAAIVFDVALWAWLLAFATLVVGLPVEDDRPSTRRAITRWASIAAAVAPVLLFIGQAMASLVLIPLGYVVIFGGTGIALIALDFTTRPSGVVSGGVASIGLVAGLALVVGALGFADAALGDGLLLALGYSALLGAEVLYVVWAIWIARRLGRPLTLEPEPPADGR